MYLFDHTVCIETTDTDACIKQNFIRSLCMLSLHLQLLVTNIHACRIGDLIQMDFTAIIKSICKANACIACWRDIFLVELLQ
jgi:hypothetical protein